MIRSVLLSIITCSLMAISIPAADNTKQPTSEQQKKDVAVKNKKTSTKKAAKHSKKAISKKPSKKAKYVFNTQENSSYKFNELAEPIEEEKKAKTKTHKKTKTSLKKDYKNSVNNTPFKTYKFDEEGNPIIGEKKSKKAKTETKANTEKGLEIGVENKKISTEK